METSLIITFFTVSTSNCAISSSWSSFLHNDLNSPRPPWGKLNLWELCGFSPHSLAAYTSSFFTSFLMWSRLVRHLVDVGLQDHFLHLFIRKLLKQARHHVAQLVCTDDAVFRHNQCLESLNDCLNDFPLLCPCPSTSWTQQTASVGSSRFSRYNLNCWHSPLRDHKNIEWSQELVVWCPSPCQWITSAGTSTVFIHIFNLAAVTAEDIGGLILSWFPTFHTTTLNFLYSTVSTSELIIWIDAVSVWSPDWLLWMSGHSLHSSSSQHPHQSFRASRSPLRSCRSWYSFFFFRRTCCWSRSPHRSNCSLHAPRWWNRSWRYLCRTRRSLLIDRFGLVETDFNIKK